jgi:hypothetical protein
VSQQLLFQPVGAAILIDTSGLLAEHSKFPKEKACQASVETAGIPRWRLQNIRMPKLI